MAEATETDAIELDENGEPKRNFRRVLEDRATEAEAQVAELQAKLQGLEKAEVFRSAGIDPNDTRQSYFVKGYDGELDAESIRMAAEEAGFLGQTPGVESAVPQASGLLEPEDTTTLQQELAAQQRIADAGVQGQPVVPPQLNDQIRATTNEKELRALMSSQGYEFDVQGQVSFSFLTRRKFKNGLYTKIKCVVRSSSI